jgi:hypothetical protein
MKIKEPKRAEKFIENEQKSSNFSPENIDDSILLIRKREYKLRDDVINKKNTLLSSVINVYGPGIYIIIACRTLIDPYIEETPHLRRQRSLNNESSHQELDTCIEEKK